MGGWISGWDSRAGAWRRSSGRYVRKGIDICRTLRVMAELGQLCEDGHRYGGTVRVMGWS